MSYVFITFSNKNHLNMNKTFHEQAPIIINKTFLLTQDKSEYFLFYTSKNTGILYSHYHKIFSTSKICGSFYEKENKFFIQIKKLTFYI